MGVLRPLRDARSDEVLARASRLAGRQGFEPRYRGPEPRVLPLDDLPVQTGRANAPELLIIAARKFGRQARHACTARQVTVPAYRAERRAARSRSDSPGSRRRRPRPAVVAC